MMEFFDKLFKSETQINQSSIVLSPIEQSLIDCKIVRDKLKQYIKQIEQNSKNSYQNAKAYLHQGMKDRGKFYLKQKKMYNEQVQNSEIQLEIINKQISSIEMSMIQSEIMKVMKTSNRILALLQEEVCVENWNIINDELSEYKAEQRQVAEFFNQRDIKDDDIDKEFAELEEIEYPNAEKGNIQTTNQKDKKEQIIEA